MPVFLSDVGLIAWAKLGFILVLSSIELWRNAVMLMALKALFRGTKMEDLTSEEKNDLLEEIWHAVERVGRLGWLAAVVFYLAFEGLNLKPENMSADKATMLVRAAPVAAVVAFLVLMLLALKTSGPKEKLEIESPRREFLTMDVVLAFIAFVVMGLMWGVELWVNHASAGVGTAHH